MIECDPSFFKLKEGEVMSALSVSSRTKAKGKIKWHHLPSESASGVDAGQLGIVFVSFHVFFIYDFEGIRVRPERF